MYQELLSIIGIDPQADAVGFILCVCFALFFIDKLWLFLYSLFKR